MATPNPFGGSPGSVNLDQTTMQRTIHGGNKSTSKIIWARCRYNGAAWEVHSSTDSNEIISGNLAWSTNLVNVTLSGFTAAPCPVVCGVGTTGYGVTAEATSATNIAVRFFNRATGAQVTTEDTSMDFMIHIVGI